MIDGYEINDKQSKVLIALLSTLTIKDAAEQCGLSEATIYNYLNQPDFRSVYTNLVNEKMKDALQKSKLLSSTAVETLAELMQDKSQPGRVRLGAAELVLNILTNHDRRSLLK